MSKSLRTPRRQRLQALLIERRRAKGLTQAEVAAHRGRPQSFVAKYEGGERRLDEVEFIEVAEALGTNPCDVWPSSVDRRVDHPDQKDHHHQHARA